MKKAGIGYWLRLFLISFISLSICARGLAQPAPDDPAAGWLDTDPGSPNSGSGSPGTGDFGTEDDPGGGGHGDPDLPIDSNILLLVVGVVGYGLKKLWDVKHNLKRKKSLQATTANYKEFIK